jgi:transcriptional regulator with XRE-family HTH domain
MSHAVHGLCWGTELAALIRSGQARGLRTRAGISLTTMAAALGVSRPMLSLVERGQRTGTSPEFGPRYLRVLRGLANHEQAWQESG